MLVDVMKLLLSTCCVYCLATKIDRQRDEVRNDDEEEHLQNLSLLL